MIMTKHLDELENKLFTVEETRVKEAMEKTMDMTRAKTREIIIAITGESAYGIGTIEYSTGKISRRSRRGNWK